MGAGGKDSVSSTTATVMIGELKEERGGGGE